MREKVEKAVEFLKQISIREPIFIRVEETGINGIVLSYEEKTEYNWNNERSFKRFNFDELGNVFSMTDYKLNHNN